MKSNTKCNSPIDRLSVRLTRLWILFGCGALLAGELRAQVFVNISLPNVTMLPNTAGQSFDVFVVNSGGPALVNSIAYNIQVADGGPAAGGVVSGPRITSVDILTGSLFGGNNQGDFGSGSIVAQVWESATLTQPGTTVSIPSGTTKLATVTLDTSGFASGTYSITLNTVNNPTTFGVELGDPGVTANLFNGSVTITAVPEPVTTAIATAAGLILFAAGRKSWSKRTTKAY